MGIPGEMKNRDDKPMKLDDLSSLVSMDDTDAIWRESITTIGLFVPADSTRRIEEVYNHTVALFRGEVPGYRECNTGYHDLRHTTDVFLTTCRLLHGMSIDGSTVSNEIIEPVLAASLLHDVGYIQHESDNGGTGAKYTVAHIKRSRQYALDYLPGAGFSDDEISLVCALIDATNLTVNFDKLGLSGPALTAARTLFNADLLGQMADRVYLEKLLFLYREFMEANIKEYSSEEELLERTLDFYRSAWKKMLGEAEYDTRHMKAHFKARWNDDRDLYTRAIDNNMAFLRKILSEGAGGRYRDYLKREGMVDRLKKLEEKKGN